MKIELTNEAIRKIQDKIENEKGHLKLKYDTEGCGCVVSGIPTLWFFYLPADGDDI